MYTNIPIQETLNIIEQQLQNHPLEVQKLKKLLYISLKQNYFQYQDSFYVQEDGLPLRSSISPIILEIFVQYLERIHSKILRNDVILNFTATMLILLYMTIILILAMIYYINSTLYIKI